MVAGGSARDICGMSTVTAIKALASTLVRRRALARSAVACKTVGSAFLNLIVGHVADPFLRLAGGAADP